MAAEFFRRVTVLDADGNVIAVVTSQRQLLDFGDHWAARQPLPPSADGLRPEAFRFRLDVISSTGSSARWLYSPLGELRSSGAGAAERFRVPENNAFNTLLSIPSK
jgi:uncharacterized protein HemY